MNILQETYDFALPIINGHLAANPIKKRNGTIIPHKPLKASDLIDWIKDGITHDECIEVAREFMDARIDDLIYCSSQEYQDEINEQDAVNREMYG